MILLRRQLGDELRQERLRQGRTLREVSAAARVSLGYLSEVERGQKEASSELLAAICTALDIPMSALLRDVADRVATFEPAEIPVAAVKSTVTVAPAPVARGAVANSVAA
jgi:transcriptional regulator with XRE-family HTH domain